MCLYRSQTGMIGYNYTTKSKSPDIHLRIMQMLLPKALCKNTPVSHKNIQKVKVAS